MIVGYARTSTVEQVAGLEGQIRDLRAAGAEEVFQEQISAVAQRVQLEAAIGFVRKGDTLACTRLDRLARSIRDLVSIVDRLKKKGVRLNILSMPALSDDATGRLLLSVFGALAEFERELMLERQREGIAKAQRAGKYRGRAPTARAKTDEVLRLLDEGKSRNQIGKQLGLPTRTVFRLIAEHRAAA